MKNMQSTISFDFHILFAIAFLSYGMMRIREVML